MQNSKLSQKDSFIIFITRKTSTNTPNCHYNLRRWRRYCNSNYNENVHLRNIKDNAILAHVKGLPTTPEFVIHGDFNTDYNIINEKKEKEAGKGVGNAICMTTIISIILCIISLVFLPQLLNIFGCTDVLKDYALEYGYVIAIGFPLVMIATALSSIIRADGNTRYSMISMVTGAVLNIILENSTS